MLQRSHGRNYKRDALRVVRNGVEQDARRAGRDGDCPFSMDCPVLFHRRRAREYPCCPARQRKRWRACFSSKEDTVAVSLEMTVNGKPVRADVDPRTLLVDFLRRDLALTGTHVGCDTAQCGACTVHLDGRAIKSCNVLALQAQGASVVTIEGLIAEDGTMHPMQSAFRDCHGLQCGFCTPGMVMSAIDLVNRHPQADEATIREALEGNLCRCTGYHNIVKAVRQAATVMGK
jgi:carbon-monoxide dehydrogenase small subunit